MGPAPMAWTGTRGSQNNSDHHRCCSAAAATTNNNMNSIPMETKLVVGCAVCCGAKLIIHQSKFLTTFRSPALFLNCSLIESSLST